MNRLEYLTDVIRCYSYAVVCNLVANILLCLSRDAKCIFSF